MARAAAETRTETWSRYGLWVFSALTLIFLIAPILVIMPLSFNSEPYFSYPMPGLSWRWYEDFFTSERWTSALEMSIIVASLATCASTVLGTLAALGLSRANFPGKALVMSVLISPMIVPVIITAVAMFFFFSVVGVLNTTLGLVMAHTVLATPFVVITVTATLSGYDHGLTRAAASMGATPIHTFRKVTLPLILPGIVSGGLFAFVTSFDEVVVVLFIASPEQRTLPKQMFSGIREMISPTITAAATLLILFAVTMLTVVELLRRRSARLRGIKP